MKKLFFLLSFLFIDFQLEARLDLQRPLSIPNHELSKSQTLFRNFVDFCFTEQLGYQALKEENEIFIKNVINDLDMNDYTIEIRGMSYRAQRIFGHINAFATGSKFFSYIYVSEDWFDTLSQSEKQALIRHELMHIKKDHTMKRIHVFLATYTGLTLITYLLNSKVNAWAHEPSYTKEYQNRLNPTDIITQGFPDSQKLSIAPRIQKLISFCISTVVASLLNATYSRTCEKEADIEAYKSMPENKQGFIDLFTNLQDSIEENKTSKFKIKQVMLDFFDPIIALFRTHPKCDERINYIHEISIDS